MRLFRRQPLVRAGDGPPELPSGRSRLDMTGAAPDEVRNLALAVCIAWGPTRGLSKVQRVNAAIEGLDPAVAQALVDEVTPVEQVASAYMWKHAPTVDGHPVYTQRSEIDAVVLARYPWVDEDNLSSIHNHACYDTWHG